MVLGRPLAPSLKVLLAMTTPARFPKFLVSILLGVATWGLVPVAHAEMNSNHLTPFVGRVNDYHCDSIILDQSNIVGFLSMTREQDRVDGYLIYRTEQQDRRLSFTMLRADAKALHIEVNALLNRMRSRPIQVEAEQSFDGECRIVQVVG